MEPEEGKGLLHMILLLQRAEKGIAAKRPEV